MNAKAPAAAAARPFRRRFGRPAAACRLRASFGAVVATVATAGAAVAAAATVLATPACHRAPREATLLLTSQLGGVTAPCGCTSRPLGGLDRIAQQVEAARAQGPAAWAVVGDTYFLEPNPGPAMRGHSHATGRTIATLIDRLGPVAVAPGLGDRGPAAAAFASLPAAQRQALALAPRPGSEVQVKEAKLGGHRVAYLQLEATAALDPALGTRLDQAATAARAAGAEGVLLLWPHDVAAARRWLGALQQVDAVLSGSQEAPHAPEPLGLATLLDGGARGEHLGALRLVRGQARRWQYFDGGAAAVGQLERQRQRMQQEAERLPPGPARQARLARAERLAAQARAAVVPPPEGTYFTWRLIDVDEDLPKAAWASEVLDAYNQALCDSALADTKARTCAPAPTPAATYVGSATCQACHPDAWAVYEQTAHARAWATLTVAHKACDLSCVGCHVVGWEQPGGFCHLDDAERWANVGCESCHGPGQGHVSNPQAPAAWGKAFAAKPAEATCRNCHNAEHSDQFDFATYRPRILGPGHGAPKAPTP